MNSIFQFILAVMLILAGSSGFAQSHNYKPKEGYIPSEEVAIKIAVAVWSPIYGKETIQKQIPYNAYLENGLWFVSGSTPNKGLGGFAQIELSKETGKILRVSHTK